MKVATYREITGKVTGLKRLKNTRDGNPRWEALITGQDGNVLRTIVGDDSALSYVIDAPEYADADHTYRLNGDGTIYGVLG